MPNKIVKKKVKTQKVKKTPSKSKKVTLKKSGKVKRGLSIEVKFNQDLKQYLF